MQERHDYNYAMYRTLYKKNENFAPITLLQMARQQIELHRPQMALQGTGAGEKGKIECSAASQFYFYQAAALYLDAQESWQEALTSCLCNPTKTAAVITGGNRKPVFTGEQSGQTGACCE